MELWQNIVDKKWNKIFPNWHEQIIALWGGEIKRKFILMKKGGSYGKIDDDILNMLLQNTEHTYLPRIKPYPRPLKEYKDPHIYTKEGELKAAMHNPATYQKINKDKQIGVSIQVPANSVTPDAYIKLENSRSIFKSSFVLVWPKIIETTLKNMGKK